VINSRLIKINLDKGVFYVNIFGSVEEIFVDQVISTLKEAYSTLGINPELLELYIYESSRVKRDILLSEALRLGISVIGDYPVSHDAWMSWPRIHVDYEKCSSLSREYFKALLYHEAAHSILHGSLSSYIVSASSIDLGVRGPDLLELVYIASVIVKDIEVHEYLTSRGLIQVLQDYFNYVGESLKSTECSSLRGILEFSKLISPCLFIECIGVKAKIHSNCRDFYSKVLSVLSTVRSIHGDLNFKVIEFLEKLLAVIK